MAEISPSRIAQVAIPVHDLERAKTFYRDRLGLNFLFDAPPGLAFFRCGKTRLMLSQPEGPETASASILYYAVTSAREAQQALAEDGVTFEADAHFLADVGGKQVWLAVCRDSEGNLLGLMSEE